MRNQIRPGNRRYAEDCDNADGVRRITKPVPDKWERDHPERSPVSTVESIDPGLACSGGRFEEPFVNGPRHILADDFAPACGSDQTSDHARTDLGDAPGRHEEDSANAGIQVSINVAHGALEFVIALGADASQDMCRTDELSIMDQVPVRKRGDR